MNTTTRIKKDLSDLKFLAKLLDSQFKFFGGTSIGLDAILSLFPVLGSLVGSFFSFYILSRALSLKISSYVFFHMLYNIVLDTLIGAIPVFGFFFDIIYKANTRNLIILEEYLNNPHEITKSSKMTLLKLIVSLFFLVLALSCLFIFIFIKLVAWVLNY